MARISRKLERDLAFGRVKTMHAYMEGDIDQCPHDKPFAGELDKDAHPAIVEAVRETFDGLVMTNHALRCALRYLEVVRTRFELLPEEPYLLLRDQLNATVLVVLRELPDTLCVECKGHDAQCEMCGGKGYYSLGELGLL